MKRRSKIIAQQCRYYEVDNIFEYMVSLYLNGISPLLENYSRNSNERTERNLYSISFQKLNLFISKKSY